MEIIIRTTVNVPWTADYNDTKFSLSLTKQSPVVIVLTQVTLSICCHLGKLTACSWMTAISGVWMDNTISSFNFGSTKMGQMTI